MTHALEDAQVGGPAAAERGVLTEPKKRWDIQGLRALAVAAVIAFHAGTPGLQGGYVGVDIFFVISGFLVTGQLTRALAKPGAQHDWRVFADFYARRIRRLLPVSFTVLIVTLVLTRVFLPPLEWSGIAQAGRATAFYYINNFLAIRNVSYLSNSAPSPFQQYWSLAVEEQFYLLWPVVLLGLLVVARRRRSIMTALVVAGVLVSCALSAVITAKEQPLAFFLLPTRAWEFGLGALIALIWPEIERLSRRVLVPVGWLGLALVVYSVLEFNARTAFPGIAASVPALGTAALVIAGSDGRSFLASTLLAAKPLVFIGEISYSLYLWHWPLLVVPGLNSASGLAGWQRLLLVALTVVVSVLSYWLLEQRFRHSTLLRARMWRSYAMAVVLTLVAAGACTAVLEVPTLSTDRALPVWPSGVVSTLQAPTASFVGDNLEPALASAAADQPVMPIDCIDDYLPVTTTMCAGGDVHSRRDVVLFGDSHAQQWFPALNQIGKRDGFKVVTLLKVSCPPMPVSVFNLRLGREYSECDTWRTTAIAEIAHLRPAAVVISHFYGESLDVSPPDVPRYWASAMRTLLTELPATSTKIVIGDGPSWTIPPPDCLSSHLEDATACSEKLSSGMSLPQRNAELATVRRAGARVIDMSRVLCPRGVCPAILWNVDVYRDANHVTATLAKHEVPTMSPMFAHLDNTSP